MVDTSILPAGVLERRPPVKPCLDCGDWIVVLFLFAFATAGAVWIFKHPSAEAFGLWTGTLATSGAVFHWLRVHDQKQADA